MKRFFCVVFSCVILMAGVVAIPISVFAATIQRPNAPSGFEKTKDVDGVYQGATATDFIKAAPIVAIYIDEEKINTDTARGNAKVEKLYENLGGAANGLYVGSVTKDPFGVDAGSNCLIFNQNSPTLAATDKLQSGKDNYIGGDLISYTFEGAASYNGRDADVVFTYSNLHIVLQDAPPAGTADDETNRNHYLFDDNYEKLDQFSLVCGNVIQLAGTQRDPNTGQVSMSVADKHGSGVTTAQGQRFGIKIDVNVQVLQDGIPVRGDFYFRMVDIDVVRKGNAPFENLFAAGSNSNYSEHVELRSGFQSSPHSVYIPGGTEDTGNGSRAGYKCDITQTVTGGYMFDPMLEDTVGAGTFYSGFMAVADNYGTNGSDGGINLSTWAAGSGNRTIKTVLLAGFQGNVGVVHTVTSVTGDGGTIKTTTNRNQSGKLDDGGQEIGPGSLMIPSGLEISYTMIPDDPRCYPTSVKVDGAEVFNTTEVIQDTDANGNTIWIYKFPGLTIDRKIEVEWYHPPYKETYFYSDEASLPDAVKKTLPSRKIWYDNGETATALNPSGLSSDYSIVVGDKRYTFNGWQASSQVVNGADVQFVGSWTVTNVSDPVPAVNPPVTPMPVTPDPVTPTPTPGFPVFPGGGSGGGGGGSTPATPPVTPTPATPEVTLPEHFVPSVETTGTNVIEGTTGLTFTYGQATPISITPVIPVGGV